MWTIFFISACDFLGCLNLQQLTNRFHNMFVKCKQRFVWCLVKGCKIIFVIFKKRGGLICGFKRQPMVSLPRKFVGDLYIFIVLMPIVTKMLNWNTQHEFPVGCMDFHAITIGLLLIKILYFPKNRLQFTNGNPMRDWPSIGKGEYGMGHYFLRRLRTRIKT